MQLKNIYYELIKLINLFIKDIIPFIDKNWESMTSAPRRTKSTWHTTISRSMTRDDVFQSKSENSETLHGLRDLNLEKIGPYNEINKLVLNTSRLNNDIRPNELNGKRGSKRKATDSSFSNSYYGTTNNPSSIYLILFNC